MCYNITMSKILIVGNILKDIYLRLNERRENLETDQNSIKWLNLGFDNHGHEFFGRESIFSGAAVTKEVLENFGLSATISSETDARTTFRYILAAGDQITYLVPTERHATAFPSDVKSLEGFDWLYVDRSAVLTKDLSERILKALNANPSLKLAFYAPKRLNETIKPLLEKASVIFTDTPLETKNHKAEIYELSETGIKSGQTAIKFRHLQKTALFTHLTTYSIIAASLLASKIIGKSKQEQLLMSKLSIENCKLDETPTLGTLENLANEARANQIDLRQMAKQLVAPGKGILAADESGGSIHKKFESMHIPDDFQHRRDYRNLFFTTDGLEKYVSGVILFDETARQTADDGRDFVKFLTSKGIIPGIKVDKGLANLPSSQEKYTLGLSGLDERLEEYFDMGLRFAKWRAAFEITPTTPTKNAVYKNVEILATYAKKCQEASIVPIVEPEVVFDGDYPIEHCAGITGIILKELFAELSRQEVDPKATLLKVNMILAGKQYQTPSTPSEVGDWTAKVLRRFVPEDLAGVVFLSGGQTPEQATANLQEVTNHGPFPWHVTFSFARALQGPALEAWQGDNKNYPAAQAAFLERLKANCAALQKST